MHFLLHDKRVCVCVESFSVFPFVCILMRQYEFISIQRRRFIVGVFVFGILSQTITCIVNTMCSGFSSHLPFTISSPVYSSGRTSPRKLDRAECVWRKWKGNWGAFLKIHTYNACMRVRVFVCERACVSLHIEQQWILASHPFSLSQNGQQQIMIRTT